MRSKWTKRRRRPDGLEAVFVRPPVGRTVVMMSVLILATWIAVNLAIVVALFRTAAISDRDTHWTARDELTLSRWAQAQTNAD